MTKIHSKRTILPTRTIFIGDVHGCFIELLSLLECIRPTPRDRLIFLGDLCNRGPQPAETIRLIAERNYECVLGNHEDHYLRNSDQEMYRQLRNELTDDLHHWIVNLPLWIETEKFIAVHAGVQPGKSPSDTPRKTLLNIRTWDEKGEDLNDPTNPPWYLFYHGTKPVFYGHWASKGLNLRENTFGLDSGCVYGGRLTAYVLETEEKIDVPSQKIYCRNESKSSKPTGF